MVQGEWRSIGTIYQFSSAATSSSTFNLLCVSSPHSGCSSFRKHPPAPLGVFFRGCREISAPKPEVPPSFLSSWGPCFCFSLFIPSLSPGVFWSFLQYFTFSGSIVDLSVQSGAAPGVPSQRPLLQTTTCQHLSTDAPCACHAGHSDVCIDKGQRIT